MYNVTHTHKISKIATELLFYLNIIALVALPFLTKILFGEGKSAQYVWGFEAILISSGICSAYILFNLKRMFATLVEGNPFTEKNVTRFRKMAVCCLIIALIYVIKCIFLFTYGTLIVVLVFVMGCLFCLTLKDLFKQAVNYKTENELTI